jgi:hypothetical protein
LDLLNLLIIMEDSFGIRLQLNFILKINHKKCINSVVKLDNLVQKLFKFKIIQYLDKNFM